MNKHALSQLIFNLGFLFHLFFLNSRIKKDPSQAVILYWLLPAFFIALYLLLSISRSKNRLLQKGVWKYIAHPLYTMWMIVSLGLLYVMQDSMILAGTTLLTFCFFIILVFLEEKEIISRFKEEGRAHLKRSLSLYKFFSRFYS